ncbi:cytochrome c [Caballeronia hypogeia]|uniref:cytochrome c n=1 Tax=Caballeronia hypogeia TaxID=1777140 RepID=UPI000B24C368|nr:cytochrome c [Caballeronia hypogeia]
MTAHLRDDDRPLPAWTTRCVNCHAGTPTAKAFAPPLTHDSLLGETRRRGGPISHYDATAFCRAVKDGIDPTSIMLRKSMPLYRITDAECAALWRFVMSR